MQTHSLTNGDFRDHIVDCNLMFADPVDNIGLGYNGYKDKIDPSEYISLLSSIVELGCKHSPHVFISFNSRWTLEMAGCVWQHMPDDYMFVPIVQTFTFGNQQKTKLTNCHRPLWWLRHKDAKCNWEEIKVPSWRQLNGDPRAKPGGKVPGDVWNTVLREDAIEDAWDFTRVVGNSKQRRAWHPTQIHEGLYERAVKLTTDAGDTCQDLFGGTGTMLRVCDRLDRSARIIELDPAYCEKIAEDYRTYGKGALALSA